MFPVLALSLISCVTATSLLISVLVYNLLLLDQLSRLFLAFPSSQGEEAALGVRGEGAGRKASHLRDPDIQTLLHLDLAFPPPAGTMEDTSLLLGKPRSSIWAGNLSAFPPQIFCYLLFCYQLSSLLDPRVYRHVLAPSPNLPCPICPAVTSLFLSSLFTV